MEWNEKNNMHTVGLTVDMVNVEYYNVSNTKYGYTKSKLSLIRGQRVLPDILYRYKLIWLFLRRIPKGISCLSNNKIFLCI